MLAYYLLSFRICILIKNARKNGEINRRQEVKLPRALRDKGRDQTTTKGKR